MVVAQPHERLAIAILYGRDHFPVLAPRLLEVAGVGQAVEAYPVRSLRELPDRLDKVRVAALGEK